MTQFIVPAITMVVLAVLLTVFKRVAPPETSKVTIPFEELRKKYSKYTFIQIGFLLLATPLFV